MSPSIPTGMLDDFLFLYLKMKKNWIDHYNKKLGKKIKESPCFY